MILTRIGSGKKEAVREDSEEGWRLDSTRRGNRVNDLRFPIADAVLSKIDSLLSSLISPKIWKQ